MSNRTSTTDNATSRQTAATTTPVGPRPPLWMRHDLLMAHVDTDYLGNLFAARPDQDRALKIVAAAGLLSADLVDEVYENSLWRQVEAHAQEQFTLGLCLGAHLGEQLPHGGPDPKSSDYEYLIHRLRVGVDSPAGTTAIPAGHPGWCITGHSEDTECGLPNDGGHYSADRTAGLGGQDQIRVSVRSDAGQDPVVEVGQPGTDGAALPPGEARRLAGLLILAADQVEGLVR